MRSLDILPENYRELTKIDLQHNKKQFLLVNSLSLLILLVFLVPVCFLVPIAPLLEGLDEGNVLPVLLRLLSLVVGLIAYIILHELVHGIAIRLISGKRAHYGFTGIYAYAGSDSYFAKGPYLIIALAPIVFWGVALGVLAPLVPQSWFWVVYVIQLTNLSGAAGDIYVTYRMLKMPKSILVQDIGTAMTVYAPSENS